MKTLLTTVTALTFFGCLAVPALAQEPGPKAYPLCNDDLTNMPCQGTEEDAMMLIPDMMLDNVAGYKMIKKSPGRKSKMSAGFLFDHVRLIQISESRTPRTSEHMGMTRTVERYEILLNDCRGTDACLGSYLWTVDAVTDSDGYCYETKYENKLEKVNFYKFPDPLK